MRLFVTKYPNYHIVNLDLLTYAGNLENLKDIENAPNYEFVKADICDFEAMKQLIQNKKIDSIIHLAAESHVDRSIKDPFTFAKTNIMGTLSLLQASREVWGENTSDKVFYHISTDEVYGALQMDKTLFTENTKYDPHSPYSASKASSDHFVRAYHDTYKLPTLISNCSNNYGSYQFPEKLIPLFINNIRNNKPLPVYGKGENVRDWLFVEDHAKAIDVIFHKGKIGETYNIGGFNEWKNIDLIKVIIKEVDKQLGRAEGTSLELITYVKDRAGHDLRYAIDATKIKNELGWEPSLQFEEGIQKTVKWYLENQEWMDNVTDGNYQKYYEEISYAETFELEVPTETTVCTAKQSDYALSKVYYLNDPAAIERAWVGTYAMAGLPIEAERQPGHELMAYGMDGNIVYIADIQGEDQALLYEFTASTDEQRMNFLRDFQLIL